MSHHHDVMPPPRFIIYSQDGLGLGHMRRTSAIAGRVLHRLPTACVLTLSDSQLGQFFPISSNHDYLKLPSIVKTGPGDWRPARLPLAFQTIQAMRQEIIYSATMRFRPDIFLVDHMPHGTMGELLPTLQALKAANAHTKLVLGLRDILDAPHVVEERWRTEGAYDAVEEFYDLVLIYGMRELFDLAEHYRFSSAIRRRSRYCGYVCPALADRRRSPVRAKLRNRHQAAQLIVVMAGGGADAYPMMRATLEALPFLNQQPIYCLIITGPFMPADLQQDLQARAAALPARVLTTVDDTYSYLEEADLVIAMAGYNTTVEILQSGKRAILVPRSGPSAEQRMRANLFAANGWVAMIDPDQLHPERFAAAITTNLAQRTQSATPIRPDLEGLNSSAEHLLALLAHKASADEA